MKHIPALDGLRAIAILIVVTSHIFTDRIPGAFGVTLFFFISGFIITRMMLAQSFSGAHFKAFYVRRFFRLAPALVTFAALSGAIMFALGFPIPLSDFAATLFYFANYHGFGQVGAAICPLQITWSLAVEEHFYLIFPIALLLSRGHLIRMLLITVVAICAWRVGLAYEMGIHNATIYRRTDTRLDSIAWGCLLSALIHARSRHLEWLGRTSTAIAAIALVGAVYMMHSLAIREPLHFTIESAAFVPIFAALFAAHRRYGVLSDLLESKAMRFVGNISYSLYLYHFLVIAIAENTMAPGPLRMGVELVGGFVAAALSYYVVENPVRRWGSRLAKRLEVSRLPAPVLAPTVAEQPPAS